MEASKGSARDSRPPLSRDRVLNAAVSLADRDGLGKLTMRSLAKVLGVEAMSLYHHVANKKDILDGMIDQVFGEIELPVGVDWKRAMRTRAISARRALTQHQWAIGLMDSSGERRPKMLRHHDAVIGALRNAGFSVPLAAHAFAVLDSFIYGFVLQESCLPLAEPEPLRDAAEAVLQELPIEDYPHLAELTIDHVLQPGYSFSNEFQRGLELILDGLERRLCA